MEAYWITSMEQGDASRKPRELELLVLWKGKQKFLQILFDLFIHFNKVLIYIGLHGVNYSDYFSHNTFYLDTHCIAKITLIVFSTTVPRYVVKVEGFMK